MLKKFISLAAVAASFFGCSGSGSSDGPSGPGAATLDDLPNCTENREGEEFSLADNGFVYRCEDGAWEFVSAPLDTASTLDDLPNCTGKIDGDSVLVKGENAVFQCTGGKWKKVRSLGMTVATADDLVSCTSRRDGDSAYVADVHSIYSCSDGKWNKVATLMDSVKTADDMPGCSDKYDGDSTYVQSDSSVYICMQKKWRLLGESVATEDDMKNCTESREDMRIFIVDIRKSLICRDGKWYSFKLADLIEDEEAEAPAESSSSGNKWEELPLSSSSAKSSSSVASSSSIASSSSEKSSSSVASSSSVKYWTLTDSRDGQTYKTVKIGTQTWMAENLNYPTDNSYCYGDDPANCQEYGRLYTWSAAMRVCPTGWHLPSMEEFKTLLSNVGSDREERSNNLRSSGWGDGADRYGFSALPAGLYSSNWKFGYLGSITYFWSSTESNSNNAYILYIGDDNAFVGSLDKGYGSSVRCLQDSNEGSEASSSSSQAKPSSSSSLVIRSSSSSVKSSSSLASSSSVKIVDGKYDCGVYSCMPTQSLNQKMYADGKYGEFLDVRDNQVYNTIDIGGYTWLAQNLNYGGNLSTRGKGVFYDWTKAMDACPSGWNVPSKDEWKKLLSIAGSASNLLSTGSNATGFSSLTAGTSSATNYAIYWTSSNGYDVNFSSSYYGIYSSVSGEKIPVRCIKTLSSSSSVKSSSSVAYSSSSVVLEPEYGHLAWWDGTDEEGRVITGSEKETGGYWFDYNDKIDDGDSKIVFPADVKENAYGNFYGPLAEAYGGIKAEIVIGTRAEFPYAGFGFNIVSDNQEGADVTEWGGICLTYSSTAGFAVELVVEDEATVTKYNNYKATVPKSARVTTACLPWSSFKQANGWGIEVDQAEILSKVATIKLDFTTSGDFYLTSIGSRL